MEMLVGNESEILPASSFSS